MTDAEFKASLQAQEIPEYQSILDSLGQLQAPFRLNNQPSNLADLMAQLDGIQYNTQGIDALRARATGTGTSPWAQMMLDKEGIERGARMDEAAKLGNTGLSKAFSSLATRGGLSAGAAQNLARKGMRDTSASRMGVNRQGEVDRLGILTQDENTKMDLLKGLPGAEAAALQPALQKTNMWASMADTEANRKLGVDKANIQTSLLDKQAADDRKMKVYEEKMKAWGADRTATAQENSGKK